MIGEVIVDDEHIAALFHEMLGDTGGGVRGDVRQAGCIVARGHDDDGVVHGAALTQRGHDLGNPGLALAYGAIDAQHILVALADNRVQRDGRLAGLAVAENQFPLTASDRNQCVDDLQARLQRFRDRCAVHDGWCRALYRQALSRGHRPFAIKRPSQRIDDTPQQAITNHDIRHAAGTLYLIPRLQVPVITEQHDADVGLVHIESNAGHTARKRDQLLEAYTGNARHPGDSCGDARDDAYLAQPELGTVRFARVAQLRERCLDDGLEAVRGCAHLFTAGNCGESRISPTLFSSAAR
jgi:hypothetical protein